MSLEPNSVEPFIFKNLLENERYFATIQPYLEPSFISDADFRVTYSRYREFFKKYERIPIDSELLLLHGKVALQELSSCLDKIEQITGSIGDDILFEYTRDFLKKKHLHKAMLECAADFRENKLNEAVALSRFEEICNITFDEDLGIEIFRDIGPIEQSFRETDRRIKTGWAWMDMATRGGWRADGKKLYLFLGAANVGKSIWLGNVATNIARGGKNVLVISFEMSEMLYAERLVSDLTKIKISDLKSQNEGQIVSKATALKEQSNIGNVYIKEFPPNTLQVSDIKVYIKKLIQSGKKIDAVVVDYIGLITATPGINSHDRGKEVAEKLRALSYIFKIPFISAAQIGRNKQKGYGTSAPDLDDIAESLALVQTADDIFGIWQEEGDAEMGKMNIAVMKSREGKKGLKTQFNIDYGTLSLTEDRFTILGAEKLSQGSVFEAVSNKQTKTR